MAIQGPKHKQALTEKLLILLKQCPSKRPLQQIHAKMLVNSIRKPNHILSKIIDVKDFDYASVVFTQIPSPGDYAFNVMIRGLTTTWQMHSLAIQFYYRMKFSGVRPNNFTYPFLFVACANTLELNHGRMGHCMVFKIGLHADGHVNHSMITMYSRCGQLGYARKVFDEISQRDVVSWNSMISGYSKMGFAREALELLTLMKDDGFEPGEMTLVSVLGACGDLGDLNLGRWVEDFVVEKKMELNTYIGSALIDMYGKCGDLTSARRIFDAMASRDAITWNAMITSYAHNGASNEALAVFNDMREAGHLYEAWEFIEKMPGKPDAIVLGALLGACQKRRNAYVSERVINLLLEVEPSNSGNYVISSKIYANMKKWDDSAKMRALMKERGVTKTPGCSWTEIGSQVHEFHAGDELHHYSMEIYQLLNDEMKKEGYVPKVDCR